MAITDALRRLREASTPPPVSLYPPADPPPPPPRVVDRVEYLTEQLNRARSLYAEAQKVTQAVSESYYKRLYGPPETPWRK